AGTVAAALVLFRFLTLVYFAGILSTFLAIAFVRLWATPRGSAECLRRARSVQGTVLAALVLVTLTAPWLWHNRRAIWAYYVVGHFTGTEKGIRAVEVGLVTRLDHLLFYPKNLLFEHVGLVMAVAVGVAAVAALLLRWLPHPRVVATPGRFDMAAAL